jgi:hypothetical protein
MLLSSIIFIFFLNHPLFAADLNIYKSVTEIRQILNGIGKYENIIDGSIKWDGTSFIRQKLSNTTGTLKDALFTVKQSTVCECDAI